MDEAGADREAVIRALFPLVKQIARRVHRMVPSGEFDDLIGDGCVGLIRAVDSFDPQRGPALEQYAARVVAGAMLNGLRRLDPVSERVRREVREAERERYELATQRGEMPTLRELEQRRPALHRAYVHAYRYTPLSLDGPLPSGEHMDGDWAADPAAVADANARRYEIRDALAGLPARQRAIVALHYFGDLSLRQIGESLAISPQRTSQLHLTALRNLRKGFDVSAAD